MSAFLTALLAALGPILVEVLVKWLTSLFNKTAKTFKWDKYDNDHDASVAFVRAAHDATPRVRIFKRALLRKIEDVAPAVAMGLKLSKADKAELVGLAAKAKSES